MSRSVIIVVLFLLYGFGYQTAFLRLNTQLEGTVISSHDIPSTGAPRYATEYVIQGESGKTISYVAGCTDASLPRSLPVGTQLIKKRWDWGYQINGRFEHDSKTSLFYMVVLSALAIFLFWIGTKWFFERVRRRQPSIFKNT